MEPLELVVPISSEKKFRLNPSLFKFALLIQIIVGATAAAVGLITIATVVTLSIVNSTYEAPKVQNDFAITYKSNYVDIDVLKNDFDIKNGKLEISNVIQPIYGKVLIQNSQTLRYFT